MAVPQIWEEEFRVLTFHMDPMSKIHLTSICNFLQEGASMHAEEAGFGFLEMSKRNQVWVLTRLKVVIDKYPGWKSKLKLKTWSRGRQGIFYIRDFMIENNVGLPIISASSSWAALNLKSRRPELVDRLEDGLHTLADKIALAEPLHKLPDLISPKVLRSRTIEYTDIDIVFHVNNVKYVELIMNSYSKQQHLKYIPVELEINYLGEALYGDEVIIRVDQHQHKAGADLISIVRSSDQREVCRALVSWAERK